MGKGSLVLVFFLFGTLCASAQNDSIAFLALGDSYTAATSELKVNSWPVQLVTQLRKKKVSIKSPDIIAQPGWTTTNLLTAINKENPEPKYNLVSLLIGVNNQYKGKDMELFEKEFPELLQTAITLAQGKPENVFVLSIPDWSVTPFARLRDKGKIVKELKLYNTLIEAEAKKMNVRYFDITQISRNASVNPSLIASDSLHPSKKMYRLWVKKISKKLLK